VRLKYVERVHGYWLDGVRCKGVSTVAKIPEDTWNLDQWRKRMVAVGVAGNPELVAAIQGAKPDDKNLLNDLAEQAMAEAGAHLKAERGTQVHTTTEQHDLGQDVDDAFDAERWRMTLDGAGFDVIPSLIERVVVFPEQKICGRFDRYALRRHDGMLAALDLKTGPSAIKYPHSTVIQLAMYANAPLMAGPMDEVEPGVFVTEEFTPLPANLDREVGYVIYLPDGSDGGVHPVNLKAGWKAVNEVVFPTLGWRKYPLEKLIRRL
jgi:hypothetical protein